MCGIAGIFSNRQLDPASVGLVKKMNALQQHRGPDDEGLFADRNCVLGHRRLAIIDLSRDGHQPFVSDDGRLTMVFNGEIYNYIELRDDLRRHGWKLRTKTDTEVLLKIYQHYGIKGFDLLNGMFALAIYDAREKELLLVRDRIGIKPLYYLKLGSILYFASEIKALRAVPGVSRAVHEQAVFDYLVFSRTDVFDETFLRQIKRVPKGSFAIINEGGFRIQRWWNPMDYAQQPSEPNTKEALQTIDKTFLSAIELRLRSDVTVGGCLSGGLDSSTILGAVHSLGAGRDFQTFTAAFPGKSMDE
ncbi:MAG: asparagine synthase (glutamine-hydrolyzing), partial [Proteobacteria bacterium]|nr:asparagine synthase (glutamine-hydrolyzing) [Pseudomonadota bacterium]